MEKTPEPLTAVRLPPRLRNALIAEAEYRGMTVSDVVRLVLDRTVNTWEAKILRGEVEVGPGKRAQAEQYDWLTPGLRARYDAERSDRRPIAPKPPAAKVPEVL